MMSQLLSRDSLGCQQLDEMHDDVWRDHRLDNALGRRSPQESIVAQDRESIAGKLLARRVAPSADFRMGGFRLVEKLLCIHTADLNLAALPTRDNDLLDQVIQQCILAANVYQEGCL